MNRKSTLSVLVRLLGTLEVWTVGLCVLLAVGLSANWQWLRGPEERRWRYYAPPGIEDRVWVPVLVCVIVGVLAIWWVKQRAAGAPSRRSTIGLIAFFVTASVSVQLSLLYLENPDPASTLFYRTVSTRNLGAFFFDANRISDVNDTLRRFPDLMPTFQAFSPQTHPPGLQLVFWGAKQLLSRWPAMADTIGTGLRYYLCSDPSVPAMAIPNSGLASATIQMAMPFWAALTIVPLYALARRLFGNRAALRAAILFIFAPAVTLFAAHWDHVYALIAVTGLYLVHIGMVNRRRWPFLAAGVLVSIASFFSLGNLAIALLLTVYAVVYWLIAMRERAPSTAIPRTSLYRTVLVQLGVFAIGVASVWIGYYLAYGVTFFEIFRTGIDAHARITGHRTYTLWLAYNLFDFFLFLGIPLVLAQILSIGRALTRPSDKRHSLAFVPLLAFWVTLLVLDGVGITRGEVARLWMFLVPVAILAGLPAASNWSLRRTALSVAVLIAQVIVLGYYVRTVGPSDYPFYVPRQAQMTIPAISQRAESTLGANGEIALLGFDVSDSRPRSGEPIELTLYWRANHRLLQSYTVFVHVLDSSGQVMAQSDGLPQAGRLPTTCWLENEIVVDTHHIPLDAVPPGTYTLQAGMYRLDQLLAGDPNHRLPVDQADTKSDHVRLGSVEIIADDSQAIGGQAEGRSHTIPIRRTAR